LLGIGLPIGFQIIVEVTTFSVGAVMMGWHGEIPLAAHQVAIGLASFTYMISLGISQATTIRVSHQLGQHDIQSVRMAAYASTHLVLIFMSLNGAYIYSCKGLPATDFYNRRGSDRPCFQLLVVAAIFQVFDGLQVIMLSALRGMADVKIPMLIAFAAYMLVGLPVSYVFLFAERRTCGNLVWVPCRTWTGRRIVLLSFQAECYRKRHKKNGLSWWR
jgi:multidrug resistance protein, MATE family